MLQSRLFVRLKPADVFSVGSLSAHVWPPVIIKVFKFHTNNERYLLHVLQPSVTPGTAQIARKPKRARKCTGSQFMRSRIENCCSVYKHAAHYHPTSSIPEGRGNRRTRPRHSCHFQNGFLRIRDKKQNQHRKHTVKAAVGVRQCGSITNFKGYLRTVI